VVGKVLERDGICVIQRQGKREGRKGGRWEKIGDGSVAF
jgi:hypothetical protein